MRIDIFDQAVELGANRSIVLHDAMHAEVVCTRGRIWITEDPLRNDVMIDAGKSHVVRAAGLAFVTGVTASTVWLREPLHAPAVQRRAAQETWRPPSRRGRRADARPPAPAARDRRRSGLKDPRPRYHGGISKNSPPAPERHHHLPGPPDPDDEPGPPVRHPRRGARRADPRRRLAGRAGRLGRAPARRRSSPTSSCCRASSKATAT